MYNTVETGKKEYKDILYIQALGDFTLKYNDKTLSGQNVRSKQVWSLLTYLISNRNNDRSLDKLIDVLWGEDEIDDPLNALKNLAYRLRNILKENLGINSADYIITKHGSYSWNVDARCLIDVDIFEELIKNTNAKFMDEKDVCERYLSAIELYKGSFMPQFAYKEWIGPLSVYYQNLYMEAVEKLCEILLNNFSYSKVEEICMTAINIDAFVEINHANLIKALIGSNNNKKALAHYDYVSKLFYDEFGIKPSNIITDLYAEITAKKSGYEKNITMLKNDLREPGEVKGIMQCNYETFKSIYRLQARAAARSGKSIFIVLLNLNPKINKSYLENNREEILENVLDIICGFLRKDDVVARCGAMQFVIMLSNITYENTVMVLDRLNKNLISSDVSKYIELQTQIEILKPVELEA